MPLTPKELHKKLMEIPEYRAAYSRILKKEQEERRAQIRARTPPHLRRN